MKASDLREKTIEELKETETQLSEQLFSLRLQKVTGQMESPAKIRDIRRDLARVLTVMNEKKSNASRA